MSEKHRDGLVAQTEQSSERTQSQNERTKMIATPTATSMSIPRSKRSHKMSIKDCPRGFVAEAGQLTERIECPLRRDDMAEEVSRGSSILASGALTRARATTSKANLMLRMLRTTRS